MSNDFLDRQGRNPDLTLWHNIITEKKEYKYTEGRAGRLKMGNECKVKQPKVCEEGPVVGQVLIPGSRGEDDDWLDTCKPCLDWSMQYCGPDKSCYMADGYCGPACEWYMTSDGISTRPLSAPKP